MTRAQARRTHGQDGGGLPTPLPPATEGTDTGAAWVAGVTGCAAVLLLGTTPGRRTTLHPALPHGVPHAVDAAAAPIRVSSAALAGPSGKWDEPPSSSSPGNSRRLTAIARVYSLP